MKSFAEYILEANPAVDAQRRNEARRTFTRLIDILKKNVKSPKPFIKLQAFADGVGFNLGSVMRDPKLFDIDLYFSFPNRSYGGFFTMRDDKKVILIAKIDPKYMSMFPTHNVSTAFEIILNSFEVYGQDMIDVFVHEFIHYQDSSRYKDPKYNRVGTLNKSAVDYYNNPKELNAHTQEAIRNMDEWFREYYVSSVQRLRTNLVKLFNAPKSEEDIREALYYAFKIVTHHEAIARYTKDKKFAMESVMTKLPWSKKAFISTLDVKNKQKVLVRLYQYYDEVLKKRFELLKQTLETTVSRLNNKELVARVKKEDPDLYKQLKKLGLK